MAVFNQGLAVLEPPVSALGLHSVSGGCKGHDMSGPSISEERRQREFAIRHILEHEDRALIQEGIEAYKRDLPQLLEKHKNQLVAYRGPHRVGPALTYEKLERELHKEGLTNEGELFITSVVSFDDEETQGRGR